MYNSNKFFISETLYYTIKRINNRIIYIPCDELKSKQRFFLNAIKWVYPYTADTLNAAIIHTGKKWVLKMDIKNFYDSVPLADIENVLAIVCKRINQSSMSYLPLVTINGKLPTGAPTSSHLANACFKDIDERIKTMSKVCGVDYSRYVDDLIFSAYSKGILKIIEKKVKAILEFYGYQINKKKTQYVSDNKQQNILGLVVNDYQVRLPKKFKRIIRAMLHNLAIFLTKSSGKNPAYLAWDYDRVMQLQGYISYIKHVDKSFYKKLKVYVKNLELKYHVGIPIGVQKQDPYLYKLKQYIENLELKYHLRNSKKL